MDPTKDLPKQQRDLIEEFVCAYNTIEKIVRQRLDVDDKPSFVYIIKQFARRHPAWVNVDLLETAAQVRNFIVHEHRTPYQPLVFPTQGLVDEIKIASVANREHKRPEPITSLVSEPH